jgi:hypothetical protein
MATDRPCLYADTIAPVHRTSAAELFLVTLEAQPETDSEDYGRVGGAYVNCWVDTAELRTAELRALQLIEANRWRAHRFESWELVSREAYDSGHPMDADPDVRELIAQAFADGEACAFYTWPIDAADEADQ